MKYALFTGAAGGLSGACVEALDKKGGWTIFAAYNRTPCDELVKRCSSNVIPIHCDIGSMEGVEKAVEEVKKYTDHLDVLANVAGVHTMSSLVEGDPVGTIEKLVNVNLMGMIRVNKAFFEMVNACKGRIINFSSECGWMQPQPFNTPYAITKWAVEAYTIGLRRELCFLDIPVIKIQPGSFKTGMHGQATDGYKKCLEGTKYHKAVLSVLSPLMTMAMKNPHDAKYLVDTCMEAIFAEKPKQNYKCKNTWYLALIDPIPGFILDPAYKFVVGLGAKLMRIK